LPIFRVYCPGFRGSIAVAGALAMIICYVESMKDVRMETKVLRRQKSVWQKAKAEE
jgi:hypothetical protein